MTQIIEGRFGKRQLGQRIAIAVAGFAIGVLAFLAISIDWRTTFPVDIAANPRPWPISVPNIEVIDGDTIRGGGAVYRLVGFDAPETGTNASCLQEHALAQRATQRLRQLILEGDVQLTRVPCACRPGTEGTRVCNFGRLCGKLMARGRDVAGIMISEGLAGPFVCGATSCPRRSSCCG
jgi:endonuclease YncB( thermonuclease family)